MVRSYDLLGLNDLRDDAARVLEKNYPNSDFISMASAARTSPGGSCSEGRLPPLCAAGDR